MKKKESKQKQYLILNQIPVSLVGLIAIGSARSVSPDLVTHATYEKKPEVYVRTSDSIQKRFFEKKILFTMKTLVI